MALVAISAGSASATAADASRLLNECQRDGVNPTLTYRQAAAAPSRTVSREFLMFGRVRLTLQTNNRSSYVLDMGDGNQPAVSGPISSRFGIGDEVCALVKAPARWNPADDLDLVDMAPAADARAILPQIGTRSTTIITTVRDDSGTPLIAQDTVLTRTDAASTVFGQIVSGQTTAPARVVAIIPARSRAGQRSSYTHYPVASRSFTRDTLPARRLVLEQYGAAVRWFNPRLAPDEARAIAGHVIWYSQVYGVDPRLVISLIEAESEFDPSATSNHGAMGLCQLMPETARDLGVNNPYDPEQNIAGAVRLLRWHLQNNMDKDDPLAIALACYNAGENAVKRYHGVPPYRETQRYIAKIKALYAQLCREDQP